MATMVTREGSALMSLTLLTVFLLFRITDAGIKFQFSKETEVIDTEKDSNLNARTPAANRDRILGLPGLDYDPGFNQFSGYLTVSPENGRSIFYWFVESQRDPQNDPVVFWTNGGPGCSGLLGLGTEHGPYFIDKNGKLTPNPHSWNTVASMLYVEQPAGVGFSYSETKDDYHTDDAIAASDNYRVIQEFLARFPERQSNDFYIASESYGGHYIPQLAKEILTRNNDGAIRFRGFLVGNPYVDPFTNTVAQFQAFYMHGLLAKPLYDEWVKACADPNHYHAVICQDIQDEIYASWGNHINRYALDYPVCEERERSNMPWFPSVQAMSLMETSKALMLSDEDTYRPCGTTHLVRYLNRKDVQEALHTIPHHANWTICAKGVVHYQKDGLSKVDLYKELMDMAMKGKHSLNMLVYSGDDDSVCSTLGTQEWIYNLGADPMSGHLWKPWKTNGQTAGFVTHFDLGNKTDATFTFATVHGAGHEVPTYRPIEALQMFKIFLRGEW